MPNHTARILCPFCSATGDGVLTIRAGQDGVGELQRHLVSSHSRRLREAVNTLCAGEAKGVTVTIPPQDEPPGDRITHGTPE
jgi:hypothetical protein